MEPELAFHTLPELAAVHPDQNGTCFCDVVVNEHISLLPYFVGKLSKGITELLNSRILKYSSQFNGVMLSYYKPTVTHTVGKIMDEQPHIHFDVTYAATIFRPMLGSVLCGTVNRVGQDHVGCLLYDCFNVTVGKNLNSHNGTDNKFPACIEEKCNVWFKVTSLDTTGDLLSLAGEYFEV